MPRHTNRTVSRLRMPLTRPIFLIIALSLHLDRAYSRTEGDNCKISLSRRGECGGALACVVVGVPYMQCADALAVGKKCLLNQDCASDLYCREGSCTPSRRRGAVCDAFQCDESRRLTCSSRDGSGTCVDLFKKGAPCEHTEECEKGAYCGGVCMARRKRGGSCFTEETCADGLSCVSDLCVTHPLAGEPCTSRTRDNVGRFKAEESIIFPYSNCAGNLDCINSKCAPRSSDRGKGVPGNDEEAGFGPKPASAADGEARGHSAQADSSGLNVETTVGLAVGIPSILLSVVAVVIGFKQLRTPRSSSEGDFSPEDYEARYKS